MLYNQAAVTIPIPPPVVGAFCLPLGVLAVVWLAFALRENRRYMRRAHRASGVVHGLTKQTYGSRSALFFPVVRFTTDRGVSVSAESKTGRNESAYRIGQSVFVLYDPDDPKDLRIDTFSSRWIGVFIPAFFALIFLGVGLVALLQSGSPRSSLL
ncbi:MAG: hypothetical protein PVS3B2_14890 [Candidatus Dormibacteraceae bacterium]